MTQFLCPPLVFGISEVGADIFRNIPEKLGKGGFQGRASISYLKDGRYLTKHPYRCGYSVYRVWCRILSERRCSQSSLYTPFLYQTLENTCKTSPSSGGL